MARIKYFNQKTGKWEYADSQYSVVNNNSSNSNIYVQSDEPQSADDGSLWVDLDGSIEQAYIEPADDDIPEVFFGGALPQTKDDTIMSFRYISKTQDISGYCKTKAQGNSSMGYPKKNQTVKLYSDAECTKKLKVDFKGWGKQNKFCFKANWVDLTHARNIVSARLWGDVVKSRHNYESIPELLRTSPNQGAVDGFPIKVYAQGIYQGRYTINIPKDAWMANMDDDLDEHCIICGENYVSGCFRAEAKIDESDWTDEVHDTVPETIKTRWNEVIRFVMNSTDDEFVSGIGNYFDVESLIDYFVFGVVICNMDGFGKNQLFDTYDGQKWYATVYDLDSTFGTYFDTLLPYNYARTQYEDYKHAGGNLLYIRLEKLFTEQIKTRYMELKDGALSLPNIINRFGRFTDIAPADLVKEDYAETTADGAFTAIPLQEQSNIQQIRNYIVKRYPYVDTYMAELGMSGTLLYKLDNPITVDSTAWTGWVKTDVKLFDEPKSFTLICEATLDDDCPAGKNVWSCTNEYSGWSDPADGAAFLEAKSHTDGGFYFTGQPNTWCEPIFGHYETGRAAINTRYSKHAVVVTDGVPTALYYITETGGVVESMAPVGNLSYVQHEGILSLGCGVYSYGENNLIDGTIHAFEIWDYAMSAEEIANRLVGAGDPTLLYSLPAETTFDGVDDFIDTGVKLFDTAKDFTIICDVTPGENNPKANCIWDAAYYQWRAEGNIYSGARLARYMWGNNGISVYADTGKKDQESTEAITDKERAVIATVFTKGVLSSVMYKTADSSAVSVAEIWEPTAIVYEAHNETLQIGRFQEFTDNYWHGTMHSFRVYDKALTAEEIAEKLADAGDPTLLYSLPEETTFDGTSGQQIDTGVLLFDEPKSFTVLVDVHGTGGLVNQKILDACDYGTAENGWAFGGGFGLRTSSYGNVGFDVTGFPGNGGALIFEKLVTDIRTKMAIVFTDGLPTSFTGIRDGEIVTLPVYSGYETPVVHNFPLVIGGVPVNLGDRERFVGTVYSLEVYDKAMTAEEIAEKLS